MRVGYRYGGALLLAASLAAPCVAKAEEIVGRVGNNRVVVRVYDPYQRDYHSWDTTEDGAYRQYLTERQWKYRHISRLRRTQRREYWTWRHNHHEFDHDSDHDRR